MSMSIEKVIAKLEEMAKDREDILPGCLGWDEAEPLREAIAKLKTHPEAQPNEPLTLEELREMDGKPVWVDGLVVGSWALDMLYHDGSVVLRCASGESYIFDNEYDPTASAVVVYRRPPEEEQKR